MPPRPLNLPKYVFLLTGDEASSKLACDVAEHMSNLDNTVFVDDFTAPIYEAFRTMFDKDWAADYGNPKTTQALMLEAQIERSEQECIAELTGWFIRMFGRDTLAKMAHKRATAQQELSDYIYVFRDTKPEYLKPFTDDKNIRGRDVLVVTLPNMLYKDPAQIISDMEELAGA